VLTIDGLRCRLLGAVNVLMLQPSRFNHLIVYEPHPRSLYLEVQGVELEHDFLVGCRTFT